MGWARPENIGLQHGPIKKYLVFKRGSRKLVDSQDKIGARMLDHSYDGRRAASHVRLIFGVIIITPRVLSHA